MNTGWIKLYRKLLDNGILKDPIAWALFSHILLRADKTTGEMTTGRYILASELGQQDATIYKALKRLEKKWKVVTLISNNRYTTVRVSNWAKYQQGKSTVTQAGNIKVTTGSQQNHTIQEYKNKRSKEILLRSNMGFGNSEINSLQEYFLFKTKLPKEDCSQKESRRYWWLLLKESKTGESGVKWLIDRLVEDEFYKNNITSSKDLYYKRVKIIARKRGDLPVIAVMPKGESYEKNMEAGSGDRVVLLN